MSAKNSIIIILISIFLASCSEKGTVVVTNKLNNVKLENINWGDYPIYGSLLPGETSTEITIEEDKDNFPIINNVSFYMVSQDKRVYLYTKENYRLNYDNKLEIIIDDQTKVINPAVYK